MRLTLPAQKKLHYLKTGESLNSELEQRIRELDATHGRHPHREVFDFGFTERELKNALRDYVQQLKDVKALTYELQERCDQADEQGAAGTDLMTELDRMTTEEMSEEHERLEKDLAALWLVWLQHKKQATNDAVKEKWSLPFGDLPTIENKDEIAAKVERIVGY